MDNFKIKLYLEALENWIDSVIYYFALKDEITRIWLSKMILKAGQKLAKAIYNAE